MYVFDIVTKAVKQPSQNSLVDISSNILLRYLI